VVGRFTAMVAALKHPVSQVDPDVDESSGGHRTSVSLGPQYVPAARAPDGEPRASPADESTNEDGVVLIWR